ncbi:MAG: RpoL/Rpb11 RNA polymerase subunit family protein [Candidatus Pacearchaeota archaeon]
MEIKIINEDKNFIEIEIDNLTIAEILRVYLNKEGVDFAAWRQDHPTKKPILRVEGQNPRKSIIKVIEKIQKELENFLENYKKLKN